MPICVIRPIVAMSGSPYFCEHVGCFWVLEPKFTIVLFDPPRWPSLQSTQGTCPTSMRKYCKFAENTAKRTNCSIMTQVRGGRHRSQVLRRARHAAIDGSVAAGCDGHALPLVSENGDCKNFALSSQASQNNQQGPGSCFGTPGSPSRAIGFPPFPLGPFLVVEFSVISLRF